MAEEKLPTVLNVSGAVEDFAAAAGAQLGRQLNDAEAHVLLGYLLFHRDPDEFVGPSTMDEGASFGIRVGKSQWVVNVKLASLIAGATFLDAWQTFGAMNAALALTGVTGKTIAELNRDTGELCVYLAIGEADAAQPYPRDLIAMLEGKDCRHPRSYCIHKRDGICRLTAATLSILLQGLSRKEVISLSQDQAIKRRM